MILSAITSEGSVVVSVEATDDYASERSTFGITNVGVFTITRSGEATNSLVVHFELSGTATPTIDYKNISSPVVIPVGTASLNIPIEAIYSRDLEPTETVVMALLPSAEYDIGSLSNATVKIWKNDYNDPSLPTVTISTDGSGGEQIYPGNFVNTLVFTFYRGGPTNQPLMVFYNLSGTAVPGLDYVGGSFGSVTIPAGSDRFALHISPIDDSLPEGYESIIAEIVPSASYIIGAFSRAEGEIIDNDPGAIPTINRDWLSKLNGALTFKVNGTPGRSFLIYSSTNLVDWELAATNSIPAGGTFVDPMVNPNQRFFRAIPQ